MAAHASNPSTLEGRGCVSMHMCIVCKIMPAYGDPRSILSVLPQSLFTFLFGGGGKKEFHCVDLEVLELAM